MLQQVSQKWGIGSCQACTKICYAARVHRVLGFAHGTHACMELPEAHWLMLAIRERTPLGSVYFQKGEKPQLRGVGEKNLEDNQTCSKADQPEVTVWNVTLRIHGAVSHLEQGCVCACGKLGWGESGRTVIGVERPSFWFQCFVVNFVWFPVDLSTPLLSYQGGG